MKKIYTLINILTLLILFTIATHAQVTYVNGAASGSNNGTSWTDAFTELQMALDATTNGEIWIASGTYTPTNVALDTFNTFDVLNEIGIYGGFAGTETTKEERILGQNTTTLSGDILGNDIDNNLNTNKEDNVFHIMTIRLQTVGSVVLDGLTFKGGNTRAASDNNDYSWRGGAIYAISAVQMSNCNFNNNFARSGGAVFLTQLETDFGRGSMIDNCVFERNACVTQGASIYAGNVNDVTIMNSTIQNNSTNRGALYPFFCENFVVNNCSFVNNNTVESNNFGGAMFIWNSTGTIRNSEFENNSAGNGAAVHLNGSEMDISVADNFIFENCSFTGNSALNFGGGAIRASSASYTVKGCQFTGNISLNGGAIFSNGENQEIIISDNSFTGNTADFGASQTCYGLYANYTLSNNSYVGNAASISGGGVVNGFGANVKIDSREFKSNIARSGGAISNQNDTTNVEIINSSFSENFAGEGNGGAINIISTVTTSIDNCLFEMNTAEFGGAINGNQGEIVDVIEGYVHISNSIILLNTASIQGAGINLVDLDLEMTNTLVATNFNNGTTAGGGLSLNTTSNRSSIFNITNSTIADNFAFLGGGIAAFEEDETSECIINLQNTLLSNQGLNYEVEGGDPSISSSGGNISSDNSLQGTLIAMGDINENADFKFINSANYNFQLEDDSPAVNNGVATGAPETDLLGNPRIGAPDSGAYENQNSLGVDIIKNTGQLSLAPNPVQSNVRILLSNDWNGPVTISIMNNSGQLIRNYIQRKTSQDFNHDLNLNSLNSGTYILSLQSNDQKISTSFIKI